MRPARRVLLDVTQDVDELQRNAELIGAFEGDRVAETEDAHAHPAHHGRNEVGVCRNSSHV